MRTAETQPTKKVTTMITTIAELQGNIASAFGLLGAAIGVGMIGLKGHESVVLSGARSLGDCQIVAVADDNFPDFDLGQRRGRGLMPGRAAQRGPDPGQ